MGQLDIRLAQSIAAERHRTVVRDADHRMLARQRAPVSEVGARHGIRARASAWLHPVATAAR